MWVMGLGLGLWENLRVTPAAVTMTPIIAPSTRYRTKMAADDETDLPAPPTPAAVYGELLCSAQGNGSLWNWTSLKVPSCSCFLFA